MNHAMVITGVELDENGKPVRWKSRTAGATKRQQGLLSYERRLV